MERARTLHGVAPDLSSLLVWMGSVAGLSLGNVLLKMGMDQVGAGGIRGWGLLIGGILLMILQFLGMLQLFRWGWGVSVVVPAFGLNYAVTAMLGRWLLGEEINASRWLGVGLILLGVVLLGASSQSGRGR